MTECRRGAVHDLERIVADLRPSAIALFTGGGSFQRSGAAGAIDPILARFAVEWIADVTPNSTLEEVSVAIDRLRRTRPDLIVAVGGGSVLDLAKVARGLAGEPDPRAAVLSGTVSGAPTAPLVAIPTTAGTGSEATHFSVVYVDGLKYSVGHPSFRPEYVLLDPDLAASVPVRVRAETGLDALSQAMESMWSTRSTDESLHHAQRALVLAWGNIEVAVNSPSVESRIAMCTAAHRAGRAIDISRTTAAHALSYAITIRHGVAHGHAVALTLGAVLEHNSSVSDDDCVDPRGTDFVRARIGDVLELIGSPDGASGNQALCSLLERLGLETTLSAVGVTTATERRAIVDSVDAERLANNPRSLSSVELATIVDGIA